MKQHTSLFGSSDQFHLLNGHDPTNYAEYLVIRLGYEMCPFFYRKTVKLPWNRPVKEQNFADGMLHMHTRNIHLEKKSWYFK